MTRPEDAGAYIVDALIDPAHAPPSASMNPDAHLGPVVTRPEDFTVTYSDDGTGDLLLGCPVDSACHVWAEHGADLGSLLDAARDHLNTTHTEDAATGEAP